MAATSLERIIELGHSLHRACSDGVELRAHAEALIMERDALSKRVKDLESVAFAPLCYGDEADGTDAPWWGIVTKSGMRGHVLHSGPFFSRLDAESELGARPRGYPKTAFVYCFSGVHSDWRWFIRALRALLAPEAGKEGK